MDFRAKLNEFPLNAFLQTLSVGGFSGITVLDCGERKGRILFKDGRVVFAQSDSQARLGASLVERGLLGQEDLDRALAWQNSLQRHRPLATLLVELGVLSPEVLESETVAHIERTVRELLEWKEGELTFKSIQVAPDLLVVEQGVRVDSLVDQSPEQGSEQSREGSEQEKAEVEKELLSFLP